MASEKKVIAFYIGSLSRGGAERVMVNLSAYFYKQGYNVYLVTKTVDEPEYEVPKGITRIIADITAEEESSSRIANLKNRIMKLRRIWKDINPDIIVSFIRKNNLMAIASSRGLKIPVVVSIRSNPARELQGKLFKPLSFGMFRFADGIVMQTTQAKAFLPGYLQKKAVIMPNSLSEQFLDVDISDEKQKEIVTVGRIDDNKNQKMLVEVFDDIRNEFPEWSLHLYGDGDRKKSLVEQYASETIVFHGSISNVVDRIKNASIFVLTSRQEGMPNALIEAMALKMACVSTDCPCGGPADLIKQYENGILIPVDDKEVLKKQLIKLMKDDELRKKLGTRAGEVTDELSPDRVNKMWMDYITGLMR